MANYKAGVRFNIDPVSKKISTPYKDFRLVRDDTNSVVLSGRNVFKTMIIFRR